MSQRFDPRWQFFHRVKNLQNILELGCGSGDNYGFLQQLFATAEFHGVDILPKSKVVPQIIYNQVDLNHGKLPYPDQTFDAILLTHVIEHLKNPFDVAEEIHRVLKPNGLIYVEAPNWTSLLVPSFGLWREQHGPFNFFDDHTHVRPWTKHSLFEFLYSACHLEVERVATVRNWLRIPWDIGKFFYGLLTRNRLKVINAFWNLYGWCIYAVGRKKS